MRRSNTTYYHEAKSSNVTAYIVDGSQWIAIRGCAEEFRIPDTAVHFASVEDLRRFVNQATEALRKHDEAELFAEHLEREKREDFAR